MKQLLDNYTISGRAITLTGINLPQNHILLITDVSNGGILYSLKSGNGTYVQGTNSVLTLSGTGTIGPVLAITYDDGVTATNGPTGVSLTSGVSLAGNQTLTAALANGSTLSSSISNFPAIQNVSLVGDNLTAIPASLTAGISLASGQNVGISSLPVISLANGSTLSSSISNFPLLQAVSGTVTSGRNWNLATSTDSLTATISSLPSVSLATGQTLTSALANGQTLTAALANGSTLSSSISNFPSIQNVSLVGSSLTALPVSLATVPTHGVNVVNGSNTLAVDSLGAATTNQPPTTATTYTNTNAITSGTVLIGPVDCSRARQACLFLNALPTLNSILVEISSDNSNWITAFTSYNNPTSSSISWSNTQYTFNNTIGNWTIQLAGALYVRVRCVSNISAGTTNIVLTLSSSVGMAGQQAVYISGGGISNTSFTANPPTISTLTQTTGTAATGTSAQALAASSASKLLAIQNTATSGTLYIGFGSAATVCTSASFALTAGQGYEFPVIPTQACWLLGSTSSVTYSILSA